jgi:hypothetical protein
MSGYVNVPWEERILELCGAVVGKTGYPIFPQWRKERPRGSYEPGVRLVDENGHYLTGYMKEGRMIAELEKILRVIGAYPKDEFPWNRH